MGADFGICVAGGKENVSRRTPAEIAEAADRLSLSTGDQLIGCSKISAKVDSAAVQDGFTLVPSLLLLTPGGKWCVVQQGMNEAEKSLAVITGWAKVLQTSFVIPTLRSRILANIMTSRKH